MGTIAAAADEEGGGWSGGLLFREEEGAGGIEGPVPLEAFEWYDIGLPANWF